MNIYILERYLGHSDVIPNVGDYVWCQGKVISRTFDYFNNRVILEVSND
jgi:hypothetical protein